MLKALNTLWESDGHCSALSKTLMSTHHHCNHPDYKLEVSVSQYVYIIYTIKYIYIYIHYITIKTLMSSWSKVLVIITIIITMTSLVSPSSPNSIKSKDWKANLLNCSPLDASQLLLGPMDEATWSHDMLNGRLRHGWCKGVPVLPTQVHQMFLDVFGILVFRRFKLHKSREACQILGHGSCRDHMWKKKLKTQKNNRLHFTISLYSCNICCTFSLEIPVKCEVDDLSRLPRAGC